MAQDFNLGEVWCAILSRWLSKLNSEVTSSTQYVDENLDGIGALPKYYLP